MPPKTPPSLTRYQRQMIFSRAGRGGTAAGCWPAPWSSSAAEPPAPCWPIISPAPGWAICAWWIGITWNSTTCNGSCSTMRRTCAAGLPKAVAAERRLRAINSEIEIEGVVADFNPGNALDLLADADLVLDGTDNFEARYLLNDACLQTGPALGLHRRGRLLRHDRHPHPGWRRCQGWASRPAAVCNACWASARPAAGPPAIPPACWDRWCRCWPRSAPARRSNC